MLGEAGGHTVVAAADWVHNLAGIDWPALFANKLARALGMLVIVWVTIWVIALVYSGYARDSDLGPIALRPHTNKRLGETKIVFDQTLYPFQMDGVEATCTFFYQYEDLNGKPRKIRLTNRTVLQLHIRSSPIPKDPNTRYGFEGPHDLPADQVIYPVFDAMGQYEVALPTPSTSGEYIRMYDLESKWTEDDLAPVVSVGPSIWELVCDEREQHIRERARLLDQAQKGNFIQQMSKAQLVKDRANVFGSYYVKMQFSKHPWFVLFRHPNQDLKMTAWVTVLTSVFALAMDAWPVK